MERPLAYFNMFTVPHKWVELGRMSDFRNASLQRFHYIEDCLPPYIAVSAFCM